MVAAFMALSLPLLAASLGLATALSRDSQVRQDISKDHYSTIGGTQHALFRLLHEPGYYDGLLNGLEDSYTITLGGVDVGVSVVRSPGNAGDLPAYLAKKGRGRAVAKTVIPAVAAVDTPTVFSYTISVTNESNGERKVTKINDALPLGFSYVAGSTSGFLFSDPKISRQLLIWDLGGQTILQPGEMITLMFEADASLAEGVYCNEAWVEPGGPKTSTGKTAGVEVGSPSVQACEGLAAGVDQVVTPDVGLVDELTSYSY